MAQSGLTKPHVRITERASSADGVRYVLQYTLRALADESHLTQHIGSTRGLATSVLRAQAAMHSFGRTYQPFVASLQP